MKGPDLLRLHSGKLPTKVGAVFPGSHVIFQGLDLHRDLGSLEWVDLYTFGVLGRRLAPACIEMIQALWVCTSYPDARLWNNRIAALAANSRSSVNLGMVAGVAASEAMVYGGNAGLRAMQFLKDALLRQQQGEAIDQIVWNETKRSHIYGYGRPISSVDERIPGIMLLAEKLGMDRGSHVTLAFDVEKVLLQRYAQLRMNFSALHAALIADMGLNVREYQLLRVPVFLGGMAPCAAEAAQKPEGVLFATPCDGVVYHGPPPRPWKTGK